MCNKYYWIHNFIWVLLSPIPLFMTFVMLEIDINFLSVFPAMNVIFSRCLDLTLSVVCQIFFFWLLIKYILKSAKSTFKFGSIYFCVFYLFFGGFALSDVMIFTKELIECFLRSLGYYSVESGLENFEKQKQLRDFILISGFFVIDTVISSCIVLIIKFLNIIPTSSHLSRR